jgi:hypothetical protein
MAKSKKEPDSDMEDGINRANVKYVAIPVELWQRLRTFAKADERSVSWAARKAIREFLDGVEGKP